MTATSEGERGSQGVQIILVRELQTTERASGAANTQMDSLAIREGLRGSLKGLRKTQGAPEAAGRA